MSDVAEVIKWENGILQIPLTAEFTATLDKAGEDGWEAWGILGVDGQNVKVAVKRPKRKITLSTDINSALRI